MPMRKDYWARADLHVAQPRAAVPHDFGLLAAVGSTKNADFEL